MAAMTQWWHRIWRPFWVLPAVCCLGALVLALLLPRASWTFPDAASRVFAGGVPGARSVLSVIATAMISVTGVVFSITVVALQLASSQFSPRVLRTFLDSRTTQVTLGVFLGTFLYSIVVLGAVGDGQESPVPQMAVTAAFAMVITSTGLFILYIHHITNALRVVTIISAVGDETRRLIGRHRPEEDESLPVPDPGLMAAQQVTVASRGHGAVTAINYGALVRLAAKGDRLVEVVPAIGDFVAEGMPIGVVHGRAEDHDEAEVNAAFRLEPERSMEADIGFGFRQLVDIAERALSPGINDPTTAIQVVDELNTLLRGAGRRADPDPVHTDESGAYRVVGRVTVFEDLVRLAVIEIAHHGRHSTRVRTRLEALLDDLSSAVRPEFVESVDQVRREMNKQP
jgi:uncharacterized membrane protein